MVDAMTVSEDDDKEALPLIAKVSPSAKRKRVSESCQDNDTAVMSKRMKHSQDHEMSQHTERDYTDTITIIVGTEAKEFMVHRDLICKVSTFFKAAFSKKWIEGQTRRVTLPELDSAIFCYYVDWVYTGKLDERKMKQYPEPPINPEVSVGVVTWATAVRVTSRTCRVAIMADFLGDAQCKKACMETLVRYSNLGSQGVVSVLEHDTLELVANNTLVDSALFRWMVDDAFVGICGVSRHMGVETVKGVLAAWPSVVHSAVLLKTISACGSGKAIDPVGTDASKYFD